MDIKAIYDLSVTLKSGMPTWPDNPQVSIETVGNVPEDGYTAEKYFSFSHSGTHVDAPSHMVHKATTVDKIDLKRLVGKGHCIRPSFKGAEITRADFEAVWNPAYENKIILINTGWDKKRSFSKEFQTEFPGLSTDAAEFFTEHRVKLIGIDTLGIEPYEHKDYRVHRALLALDIPFIEDLSGLDQLEEGKEYIIAALPLKIGNGSGSMARVVAMDIG